MIHDPQTWRSVILGLGAPTVLYTRLLITYFYILVPWTTKLLPWWSLQGIKDETLLVFVLSRVAAKEFSLEEMVIEFQK